MHNRIYLEMAGVDALKVLARLRAVGARLERDYTRPIAWVLLVTEPMLDMMKPIWHRHPDACKQPFMAMLCHENAEGDFIAPWECNPAGSAAGKGHEGCSPAEGCGILA